MRAPFATRVASVIILGAIFIGPAGVSKTYASAQQSEIRTSLGYLRTHQDAASGGLKEEGQEIPSPIVSGWGAIAFSSAGYETDSLGEPSLGAYLEGLSCQFTAVTDIERVILVVSAEGKNPRDYGGCDLASKLENNIDAVGGMIGGDIVSTVFGVLALSSYDAAIPGSTISYIVSQQKADGGWDSGWGTEANITAQAIMALSAADYDKLSPVIANAKQFLKNLQSDSGGIKYDANAWTTAPDAFSDAYSVQAIYALDELPTDAYWVFNNHTIFDDLATLRQSDGSYNFSSVWGAMNPVWTTAVVLPALAGKPLGWQGGNLVPFDEAALLSPAPSTVSPPAAATSAPTNLATAPVTNTDVNSQPSQDTILNTIVANNTNESLSLSAEIPAVTSDSLPASDTGETIMGATDESPPNPNTPSKILIFAALIGGGLAVGATLSIAARRYLKILLLVLISSILLLPSVTLAARAGIVVRHASGDTKRSCVSFSETSITGLELLKRASMIPVLDNGFVVEIDGERAKSYGDAGVKDDYWSYWYLNSGEWQYSPLGASWKQIHDGEINGWQRGGSSLLFAPISFDQICPPTESAIINDTPPPATVSSIGVSNTTLPAKDTPVEKVSGTESVASQAPPTDTLTLAQDTIPNPSLIAGASSKTNNTKPSNYLTLLTPFASILSGFLLHRLIRRRLNHKHTS